MFLVNNLDKRRYLLKFKISSSFGKLFDILLQEW